MQEDFAVLSTTDSEEKSSCERFRTPLTKEPFSKDPDP